MAESGKKKVLVFLPTDHITAEKAKNIPALSQVEYFMSNQLDDIKKWEHYGNIELMITAPFGAREALPTILKENSIKWIHCIMAGVDGVLVPELKESDIILTNSKGSYSEGLSEFALSCILFFYKNHARLMELKANREWVKETNKKLAGDHLVVVGYGDIGTHLARMCKLGMNMKVTGVKRNPASVSEEARSYTDNIVGLDQLDTVLGEADVVVGVLPGTPETFNFFDKQKFAQMKSTALFMNVGRGVTVHEDDLYDTLKEKKLWGAALDVFHQEPLPSTSKLFDLDNLFYSPHSGDIYGSYWQDGIDTAAEHLELYLKGEPLKNIVDKQKGY